MAKQISYNDGFSGVGSVTIRPFKINDDGTKTYFPIEKNNLIVEKGRASLIDLMIGAERKKLTYIRWGKGGAKKFPDGDPLNPLAVEDKDENVYDFLLDKELNAYDRKSPTEVEYVETLICDEVDSDVNEAAMLFEHADTNERTIFARITFPTVRLTIEQGTGIEIRWVFNFSKAEEIEVEYEDTPIGDDDDTTPPGEVSSLEESHTGTSVTLYWTNPSDSDFAYVNIYRNGDLYDEQIADTRWTDANLNYATTYNYRITTVDASGNESNGTEISVTTAAS